LDSTTHTVDRVDAEAGSNLAEIIKDDQDEEVERKLVKERQKEALKKQRREVKDARKRKRVEEAEEKAASKAASNAVDEAKKKAKQSEEKYVDETATVCSTTTEVHFLSLSSLTRCIHSNPFVPI
jgi:regulator of protease activity HflC (stomatin/prohibitin superfamily)